MDITQRPPVLPHPAAVPDFQAFFHTFSAGPVIPGLVEGAVPQGVGYDARQNRILISAYFDGPVPSAVFSLDRATGTLRKTVWLATENHRPLHGHVGGIAVGKRTLWVASDEGVYAYALDRFDASADGDLLSADSFSRTSVVASSATFHNGVLWIGEFAYYGPGGGAYHTGETHHLTAPDGSEHHALLAGYRVRSGDGALESPVPDLVISIPDRVQGSTFSGDHIFLSVSYGRRNRSELLAYRNPLSGAPAGTVGFNGGTSVPLWFLDRGELVSRLTAPPMMEGITAVDDRLMVLFESGAEKYRYTGLSSVSRLFESNLSISSANWPQS